MELGVQEIYQGVFLKLTNMVEAKEQGWAERRAGLCCSHHNASANSLRNSEAGTSFRVVTN